MNTAMQGLLRLIKNALCGEAKPLPEGCDFEAVTQLAIKHQVETLAYDGAKRCGYSRKDPIWNKLFVRSCEAVLKSELQIAELEKLYLAFDEAHVDYMPLKGCIMKKMYPAPEFRAMNDADILIRQEQYNRTTKGIMEDLGYRFKAESDCELKWIKTGLYLELHKRLIPSFIKDFYAYFGEGWELAHAERGSRYAMSKEDEFLFIFTHFARHYREGGVGIRPMVDIWLYRRNNPQMNEEIIVMALKKLSLGKFYSNVLLTLANWFDDGEETDMTSQITEYIENSGSFGNEENKSVANSIQKAKGKGKGIAVVRMLFPSLNDMRYTYPILKKCLFLLPAVWVYRWFKVLFVYRERLKIQETRLREMDTEKMDSFERALRAVGLEMKFEEK